jgi:hypothetical protein
VLGADDLCGQPLVQIIVVTEQVRVVQRLTRLVGVERLKHLGQAVNLSQHSMARHGTAQHLDSWLVGLEVWSFHEGAVAGMKHGIDVGL